MGVKSHLGLDREVGYVVPLGKGSDLTGRNGHCLYIALCAGSGGHQGASRLRRVGVDIRMNYPRQPVQWPCQKESIRRRDSFSARNSSRIEGKLAYIQRVTMKRHARLRALSPSYWSGGQSVICVDSCSTEKRFPSCSPRSRRGESPCFIALKTSGASRFCNSSSHTPAASQQRARA